MVLVLERKTAGYILLALTILLLITLSIVKYEFDRRNEYLCELYHTYSSPDMSRCPAHQGTEVTSWLLVTGFILTAMIAATGGFLLLPEKDRDQNTPVKRDFSELDADERRVCEALMGRDGAMYQSDLLKETGFSKVKLTRVLDRLTAKGLVERHRRGMTNLVVLK